MNAVIDKHIIDNIRPYTDFNKVLKFKNNAEKFIIKAPLLGYVTKEINNKITLILNKQEIIVATKLDNIELSYDASGVFSKLKLYSINFKNLDTKKCKLMFNMFYDSDIAILNFDDFDTSNVTDMSCMFHSLNTSIIDIRNLDTSKVENMNSMFAYSIADSILLKGIEYTSVKHMNYLFHGSKVNSLDIGNMIVPVADLPKDILKESNI